MNLSNNQIRAKARKLLDDNIFGKDWVKSVIVFAIQFLIIACTGGVLFVFSNMVVLPAFLKYFGNISPILNIIVEVILDIFEILLLNILIGPIHVGSSAVYIDLVRGDGTVKIKKFFYGFKKFFDNFMIGVMYTLHITLWTLFLVFPGIYVSLSYALAFHVKRDHPDYNWKQCFDESERLMDGNRWKYLKLQFSFIGWTLLGAIAFLGIGSLWVSPYISTSNAIFYEQVKAEKKYDIDTL